MLAECFHVTPDRRIARPILDDPALGAGQIGLPGRAARFEIRDSIPHGNGIPPRPRTPNGNVRQMGRFVVPAEPCEQARNDFPAKAGSTTLCPKGSRLKLRFVTGERSVIQS